MLVIAASGFWTPFQKVWDDLLEELPEFILAILWLIIGWVIALFISKIVAFTIRKTSLDKKLSSTMSDSDKSRNYNVEFWITKGVYYFLILLVLAGFFYILGVNATSDALNEMITQVTSFIPRLILGGLLLVFGMLIASVVKVIIARGFEESKLDEKLLSKLDLEQQKDKKISVSKTLAEAIYWVIILITITFILETFGLSHGILQPVRKMFETVFSYVPNLFGALILLVIGWLIARMLQKAVTNFLLAAGSEDLSDKVGLKKVIGQEKLASILGLVCYILVLIPVFMISLETLKIRSLTGKFSNMLDQFVDIIPDIFGAGLLILVAYITGSMAGQLSARLLEGFGFNKMMSKIGVGGAESKITIVPAEVVGKLIHIAIVVAAAMVGCEIMQFNTLSGLIYSFLLFGGRIIIAAIIFMIGLYLANLAASALKSKGGASELVALMVKIMILVIAGAYALTHVGLQNSIVYIAFGSLVGAVAIAIAIAFGIGGIKKAGEKLDEWDKAIQSKDKK